MCARESFIGNLYSKDSSGEQQNNEDNGDKYDEISPVDVMNVNKHEVGVTHDVD